MKYELDIAPFIKKGVLKLFGQDIPKNCTHLVLTNPTLILTSIDDCFLQCCENLKEVDLSSLSQVTNIDSHFLYGCRKLEKINLSGIYGQIRKYAFLKYYNYSKSKYLPIPLKEIKVNAKTNPELVDQLIQMYPKMKDSLEEQRTRLHLNVKSARKR